MGAMVLAQSRAFQRDHRWIMGLHQAVWARDPHSGPFSGLLMFRLAVAICSTRPTTRRVHNRFLGAIPVLLHSGGG